MLDALQNAAAGMLSSSNRAAAAAQNIVVAAQSQSPAYSAEAADIARGNNAYQLAAQTSGKTSPRLPSSGFRSGSFSLTADLPADFQNPPRSLEEEIISLKIATQAYKANAAVFRTISQITGSLIEIKT